ncbi:hypothetical protein A3715_12730 [Oleiphilus sp. HI0009]|nr:MULTISPECIES: helix-turn-helix domain-containing protein [unclassified Oleiphilus]KZX76649.1 hypothetical protein A3715_12730 [Oleiphilus sp. HI0009]KZY63959.1 hypothetical protein A3738_11455 [Oleiphilus sp. HI0066]KZY67356.1 hypothetical protein A3739_01850 [Oleiphilus sp. HI0067]
MAEKIEIAASTEEKERIYQLLRLGAEKALVMISKDEIIEQMEQAGMYGAGEHSDLDDPVLIAATRRSIRSSLIHWLNSTIENPEQKVAPFVSDNIVQNALAIIERGVPELMLALDRAGQNVAWQYWMNVAFEIAQNPRELKLLLDVSFRSISSYIDTSRDLLQSILKEYSDDEQSAYLAKKRDLVVTILEGHGVQVDKAIRQLDYPMTQAQHAAVVWSDEANLELNALEKAAEYFVKCFRDVDSLSVIVSAEVMWIWVGSSEPIDTYRLRSYFAKLETIKLSYASAGKGLEGFRKAHMDALAAQRILGRFRSGASIVSYEQLRLAEMLSRDLDATNNFIRYILGDLARSPKELRQSLLAYIGASCNASKAADQLHTHRNTLLRRLTKARELLPRPLEENLIQVGAALELSSWLS